MNTADVSTTPTASTPKDTIVSQPSMTQAQALRQLGWIQPIDYALLLLVGLCWVTLLYWNIFGNPTPVQTLADCLVAFGLLQIWVIILVYRCAHFVLLLTATVNNMPEDAARMVVGFYSGRPPMPTPKK